MEAPSENMEAPLPFLRLVKLLGGTSGDVDEEFEEEIEAGEIDRLAANCARGDLAGAGLFDSRTTHFHAKCF
jgi:hypothetical protein